MLDCGQFLIAGRRVGNCFREPGLKCLVLRLQCFEVGLGQVRKLL